VPSADAAGCGLLTLDAGRNRTVYVVCEFPTPLGRGFHFAKATEGTDREEAGYDVLVANHQDHACTCKGHARHGHCKHVDAVAALIGNRWLEPENNPLFTTHVDPAVDPFA
jgi:hypothetical protein